MFIINLFSTLRNKVVMKHYIDLCNTHSYVYTHAHVTLTAHHVTYIRYNVTIARGHVVYITVHLTVYRGRG